MIDPSTIRQARLCAGLTQREAAELLGVKLRRWEAWEQGENPMHRVFWDTFVLKVRLSEKARGIG